MLLATETMETCGERGLVGGGTKRKRGVGREDKRRGAILGGGLPVVGGRLSGWRGGLPF